MGKQITTTSNINRLNSREINQYSNNSPSLKPIELNKTTQLEPIPLDKTLLQGGVFTSIVFSLEDLGVVQNGMDTNFNNFKIEDVEQNQTTIEDEKHFLPTPIQTHTIDYKATDGLNQKHNSKMFQALPTSSYISDFPTHQNAGLQNDLDFAPIFHNLEDELLHDNVLKQPNDTDLHVVDPNTMHVLQTILGEVDTKTFEVPQQPQAVVKRERQEEEKPSTPSPKRSKLTHKGARKHWTPAEDEALKQAVNMYGTTDFTIIAEHVPGRNNTQCRARWVRVLKPGLKKGYWSESEDKLLRKLIEQFRDHSFVPGVDGLSIQIDWNKMKGKIVGRSVKQCRERWTKNLDPRLKKGQWTKEEDAVIVEKQKELGNRWAEISRLLTGRTEHSVKTRWRSLMRVHKRHWTKEEDIQLLQWRAKLSTGKRWDKIAAKFKNRTKNAVMTRYKVLNAQIKKGIIKSPLEDLK